MSLTRSQILGHAPPAPVRMDVPGWEGSVFLRVIDGRQRETFERVYTAGNRTDIRASMLVQALCDESGAALFTEADIPMLNAQPAHVLMPLYDRALEINAVTREAIEEIAGE